MTVQQAPPHPVVECATALSDVLDSARDVDPLFMSPPDKQAALLRLMAVQARVEELRLRLLACSEDLAEETAARDAAAWLAYAARVDGAAARRDLRLAQALERRWRLVADALATGRMTRDQAETVVSALDALPADLPDRVRALAESRMVELADSLDPRRLRICGRRLLEVVAPDLADEAEQAALEREERVAARRTFLRSRRNGDGTTDLRIRVSDAVAGRLLTYLQAFTSPRHPGGARPHDGTDQRPHDQRLGHAFGALLETVDPQRLPLHGGTATSVVVTIPLSSLRAPAGTAYIGDEPISAGEARRLACTASIIPTVLGGESEVLDLGRQRRLFSPAQRKAMAVRDVHCRAEACDIPAAWCEAHHAADPWSAGGLTDFRDGVLLCSWHPRIEERAKRASRNHHRAHDDRYDQRRLTDGSVRFARRT